MFRVSSPKGGNLRQRCAYHRKAPRLPSKVVEVQPKLSQSASQAGYGAAANFPPFA
jgi:hypothetical protein